MEAGGFTQILLNVTPSEVGDFDFKVKAESTSDPKTYVISTASIHVEGVSNQPPVCACLTPDKPESEPGKVIRGPHVQSIQKAIRWSIDSC